MVDVMLFGVYICIVININGFVMVKGYLLFSKILFLNNIIICWGEFGRYFLLFKYLK